MHKLCVIIINVLEMHKNCVGDYQSTLDYFTNIMGGGASIVRVVRCKRSCPDTISMFGRLLLEVSPLFWANN